MTDTPIADALASLPKNTFEVEATDTQGNDPKGSATLERDWTDTKSTNTVGVEGDYAKKEGWSVKAFFKKVWK